MEENYLKISGSAYIENAPENDCEYQLACPITFYSTGEKRSLQTGEFSYHHKAKVSGAIELKKGDKIIHGSSKQKISQKLRARMWLSAQDEGVDADNYYEKMGNKLIVYWDVVAEILKNKE